MKNFRFAILACGNFYSRQLVLYILLFRDYTLGQAIFLLYSMFVEQTMHSSDTSSQSLPQNNYIKCRRYNTQFMIENGETT